MYNFDENKNVLALFPLSELLTVTVGAVMHVCQWANYCRVRSPTEVFTVSLLLFLHSTLF